MPRADLGKISPQRLPLLPELGCRSNRVRSCGCRWTMGERSSFWINAAGWQESAPGFE